MLAASAPSTAAAWTETATDPIPDDGPAACLREAGPGRLALAGPIVAGRSTVDVLALAPNGPARDSFFLARTLPDDVHAPIGSVEGRGRRRFALTLRLPAGVRAGDVELTAISMETGEERRMRVPIR